MAHLRAHDSYDQRPSSSHASYGPRRDSFDFHSTAGSGSSSSNSTHRNLNSEDRHGRHSRLRPDTGRPKRSRSVSREPGHRRSWPPNPTVEDAASSVAKEAGSKQALTELKKDDEIAARGVVNQEPLIEDVPDFKSQHEQRATAPQPAQPKDVAPSERSSSSGLPTPPTSEDEKSRRGRNKLSRLQTDQDAFAPEFSRRAPSPYSITRPSALNNKGDSSSSTFLSPDTMTPAPQFPKRVPMPKNDVVPPQKRKTDRYSPSLKLGSDYFTAFNASSESLRSASGSDVPRKVSGQPLPSPRRGTGVSSPSAKSGSDYFSAGKPSNARVDDSSDLRPRRDNSDPTSQTTSAKPTPNPSPRTSVVDFAPPPSSAASARRHNSDTRRHTDVTNAVPKPRLDKLKRPTPLAMSSAVDDNDMPTMYSVSANTTPSSEYPPPLPRQRQSSAQPSSYQSSRAVSPSSMPAMPPVDSPQRSPRVNQGHKTSSESRPRTADGPSTPGSVPGTPRLPQTNFDWSALLAANAQKQTRHNPRLSEDSRTGSMAEVPRVPSVGGNMPMMPPRPAQSLPYPEDDRSTPSAMPTETQYQFLPVDKATALNTAHDPKSKLAPSSRVSSARPSLVTRHSAAPATSIEQRSPVDGRWPPEARTLTPEIRKEIAKLFKRSLPSCNRPAPVAGHDDWYTLIGSPGLDFCPDCIDDMFERTIYRAAFRRSPPRNLNAKVQCAFGSPWIRLAWLLTLERERTDLMLLRDMAEVDETSEPCAGSHEAVRSWYGLRDPEGYFVRNFHVCYSDIRKIERLLPTLSGLFVRLPNRVSLDKRLCAMRADANRFPIYMKSLLTMHEKAHETRKLPDQMPLIQLVERKTRIRECSRDNLLLGERWHFIPDLPHFTVCEDCYESIVEPEARKSKDIAVRFNRTSKPMYGETVGSSCQLYSPRMRKVFKNALEDDSIKYLNRKTKERRDNELRLQEKYQDVLRRAKRLSAGRAGEGEGKRLDWELEKITEEWQDKWE